VFKTDQRPLAKRGLEGFYVNLANVAVNFLNKDCAKFSASFQHVLRVAKQEGFDYINFDSDGTQYDVFKLFDW